ncbi:MAG TPA: GNAT family N-acetyltransferase [Acetivibrio sp.]|nr:GNAT family N-acetyltransferase [Acetivibrio sp.]
MYSLNIKSNILYLRDIGMDDLGHILKLFNDIDSFKFATGIYEPVTLNEIKRFFLRNLFSQKVFCSGIFSIGSGKIIGMLKGQLAYNYEDTAWINTMIIEPEVQRKGYGTEAVNLLIGYLKENSKVKKLYLSVLEENYMGKHFWEKQNFSEIMRIDKNSATGCKHRGISIMYRQI